jgi:hypothetical protein
MHTQTKSDELHIDSLGQRNPAVEMEKINIAAANKRTDENAKLEGTPRSRALEASQKTGTAHPAAANQPETQDYEAMTVPDLKELAKERGVEVSWDARKDEIITALEKNDKKH